MTRQLSSEEIKRLFPNATKSLLEANQATTVEPKVIKFKKSPHKLLEAKCFNCGLDFQGRAGRKYCSPACAYASPDRVKHVQAKDRGIANCEECGSQFKIQTRSGKARFCSQSCARTNVGRSVIHRIRVKKVATKIKTLACPVCGTYFRSQACANRIFCSQKCSTIVNTEKLIESRKKSGKPGAFPRTFTRGSARWLEIGGKRIYARSSWEANYACYLEWMKAQGAILEWEHEPDTFWFDKIKRGVRSYLPDFKLTSPAGSVEYHEVKGWMDSKSKTKIKRMAKYHPSVTLRVIGDKWFKANSSRLRHIIPGWVVQAKKKTVIELDVPDVNNP